MLDDVALIDPLGKTIYFLADLFTKQNSGNGVLNDVTEVITKPAILVEVQENDQTRFYYFRSVGGNKTFAIIVRRINDQWQAYHCIKNPAGEMLSMVLKKGKQIL